MTPRHTAAGQRRERRSAPRGAGHVLLDPLYGVLRVIARYISGFWAAIAAFLTVGLIVGIALAAMFAGVAGIVQGGITQRVDESVLRWFAQHRTPTLDEYMLEITALGSGIVLIVLVGMASIFLWLTHHRWSVYILLVSAIGGLVLSRVLKNAIGRERPFVIEMIDQVSSSSFPSGHSMSAIIGYGSVAYLVGRLEPSRRLRRAIWLMAALIILTIGVSRMYLGVHYPSDVVGGYLAGLAWLLFVAASTKAITFFAPRRPETQQEEPEMVHPPGESS